MAILDTAGSFYAHTRAHEVEHLIEVGRKCGIVADPGLFRDMVYAVYGEFKQDDSNMIADIIKAAREG